MFRRDFAEFQFAAEIPEIPAPLFWMMSWMIMINVMLRQNNMVGWSVAGHYAPLAVTTAVLVGRSTDNRAALG